MPVKLDDKILIKVEKPARYTGGELNSVIKKPEDVTIRFAFCFPDSYEVGMSHLGMKILYHMMNERADTWCERVFAPWIDMEAAMRENGIPLYALESRDPVGGFDLVGFTLQYEMSYTNVVNMLDLAGVPILSAARGHGDPFVLGGGPCAYNPEPVADIFDFFVLGEGEEATGEVLDTYTVWRKSGGDRADFLRAVSTIPGVYVPSLYDIEYNDDRTIKAIKPKYDGVPAKITKRIVRDLDRAYFPDKMIVPFTAIVHDRIMLEVFRGCPHGCRFCQAGFVYRPMREKSPERLLESAEKLVDSTGYDEISLVSLSISDYSELGDLTERLTEKMSPRMVGISLPSLRVDSFSLELMEKAGQVRKSGLTFAPEAGTQRLRDVVNKGVTEDNLYESVKTAFSGGWNSVKLYFMIGLPTETYEDLDGIAELAARVIGIYRRVNEGRRAKPPTVTVSVAGFVPKPFTPFQWEPMDSIESLKEKQRYLKQKLTGKNFKYNYHDAELSALEAVFARGDRRLCAALVQAWQKGCKFDGWTEHFKKDKWDEAFAETGIDPEFYANRKREYGEILPWSVIDIGVTVKFLEMESRKAQEALLTPDCRRDCSGCGVTALKGDAKICRF